MDSDGFQKLDSSGSLEFNNKSVEETLLGVAKWALLSLRLPGYFPLTVCRSNAGLRLELIRCSTVTFYTVLVTTFSIFGSGFFYYSFVDKFFLNLETKKTTNTYGNTASFIWFSLMVLVTYTTYLRFSRIFFCRGSLKFWQKFVRLIELMVASGYQLNSSHFYNVFSSIRKWVIFYFLVGGIRIAYGLQFLYKDLNDPTLSRSIKASSFLDVFLAITLCFHVGYNIWLTFLVKIITICYETIHDDLDGMACTREPNSQMNHSKSSASPLGLGYYSSSAESQKKTKTAFIHLERKIEQTIQTYETIEDHMHKFNRFFGRTLILESTFAVIILIVNVYAGVTKIGSNPTYTIFVMGTPVVIYSSALFHFASDSAILSGRAVGVLKKLERFIVSNDRHELQALQLKVVSLIARVADNPPTISASHFFTMNRHLLTAILGTITTYLIVLLQFRDSAVPSHDTSNNTLKIEACPENLTFLCSCGTRIQ